MPVDEATTDAALVAFRERLTAAVHKRDIDAVVALSDPKIRTSFGGAGGVDDLRNALKQAGVWEDFEHLLSLGGTFRGEGDPRSFWAPYVYSAWPDAIDPFEHFAVVAKDVPLHESEDPASRVIATLSYDIVRRAGDPARTGAWQKVLTVDDRTGFVATRSVRSPIGYRAGFVRENGEWRMNALVAGD